MKQVIILLFLALFVMLIGFVSGLYQYRSRHGLTTGEMIKAIKISFGSTELSESEPAVSVSLEEHTEPLSSSASAPEPKQTEQSPVSVIDAVPKYEMETGVAARIIADAEVYYRQLDWPKAIKKLESVLGSRVEPGMMSQGKELKNKCQIFWELLSDIPPEEMNTLNNWVKVQLNHGVQMQGQLIKETAQGLRLRFNNFETEVSVTQISSYQKITQAERKVQLKNEYDKKLAVFGSQPTAYQYYETAVFCYKNQLMDEVVPLLEKAWDRDKNILITVKDEQARSLYETYLFCKENNIKDKMSETLKKLEERFPQSKYAALIKKAENGSADKPEVVIEPVPPVVSTTLTYEEVKKIIDQGNKYYDDGLVHLHKTFERGPDFDEENDRALSLFREAVKLYEQALQHRPKDIWLQNRRTETFQCIITVRKQKR